MATHVVVFWYAMRYMRKRLLYSLCFLLSIVAVLNVWQSSFAAAGINKQINFQSKVVNSNGTNVTDGTYDFVFKVYNGASSGASTLFTESWTAAALWSSTMSSAPASAGESLVYSSNTNESTIKVGQILTNTTKAESVVITTVDTGTNTLGISPTSQAWAVSDTVTNKIYVKDGIFRVAINSLNADVSGIDFNSDTLFLGVNFNADGEAKPRIQMAAAPYAFNAEKVAGLTLSGTSGNTYTFPTTNSGTVITNNAPTQTITSTQTSGTMLALSDSTGLSAAITGLSVTLSGTGAFDQTGLAFNLSNASGTNLNDVLGTGSTWKISKSGALTAASGIISSGALAVNSGSITATGDLTVDPTSKFIVNAADTLETNDVTAPAATALTLTGNAASAFNTSSGALSFQVAGTGTTSDVQIGAGGAGSGTPDLLKLDVKSSSGDPSGAAGAMYYNANTSKFRCYEGSAFGNCIIPRAFVMFYDSSTSTGTANTTNDCVAWTNTGNVAARLGQAQNLTMDGFTTMRLVARSSMTAAQGQHTMRIQNITDATTLVTINSGWTTSCVTQTATASIALTGQKKLECQELGANANDDPNYSFCGIELY